MAHISKLGVFTRVGIISTSIAVAILYSGATLVNAAIYHPVIIPSDFTTEITNPYFSLPVGTEFEYKGETEEGTETNEIEITGDTKKIMGVTTLIYHDRVWLDGELIEDTRDYLAQNKKTGDVWYFGEDVDNYEDGKLADHDGSWHAGVDGAEPGIWMLAHPKIGDEYRQEYYAGEAEDMGKVLSLTETVTVPYGTFTNCLKTKDWTPLEPGHVEEKVYCPKVAGLVLELNPQDNERIELIDVDHGDDEDANDDANDDDDEEVKGNNARIAQMETLIGLLRQLIALLQQQKAL